MSSQAMACTVARSRGGKIELSPASWFGLQGEIAKRPAASPTPNRDGRHLNFACRFRMRRLWFAMQEAGQCRTLALLKRNGTSVQNRSRLGQELCREIGAMRRFGAAHGWHPVALRIRVSIRRPSLYQKTRFGNLIIICEMDHLVSGGTVPGNESSHPPGP